MDKMTILQAALCGVVYWLAVGNLPFVGLWSLQRPLVCGLVTGCILGHPVEGAVIGATINLVYLGFMSAGGSMPADMGLAGVLGTAYAIVGGLDTDTALALAVPIGILGTIVWAGRMTFDSVFVHMADKYIESGKTKNLWVYNWLLPNLFCVLVYGIPAFIVCYFGASGFENFMNAMPSQISTAMTVIGSVLPALGIGMMFKAVYKKKFFAFAILGFVLVAYLHLDIIACTLVGAAAALLYWTLGLDKLTGGETE